MRQVPMTQPKSPWDAAERSFLRLILGVVIPSSSENRVTKIAFGKIESQIASPFQDRPKRSEFTITLIELKLIAALAHIGVTSPKAASGTLAAL